MYFLMANYIYCFLWSINKVLILSTGLHVLNEIFASGIPMEKVLFKTKKTLNVSKDLSKNISIQ